MSGADHYTFSDTDLARQRLDRLAEVFAEPTTAFLRTSVGAQVNRAIDLGCGPGNTTQLIADTLNCESVVGLDASETFIATAQTIGDERLSFHMHDVTSLPLPGTPADLIYCRLLLAHLTDPLGAIQRWTTQLTPTGRLLVEEVDDIRTDNEALSTYVGIVIELLHHHGQDLYVGRKLEEADEIEGVSAVLNRSLSYEVPVHRAAGLFSLNIQVWQNDEFIRENYSEAQIAELQDELLALAAGPSKEPPVEWLIRQVALEAAS